MYIEHTLKVLSSLTDTMIDSFLGGNSAHVTMLVWPSNKVSSLLV